MAEYRTFTFPVSEPLVDSSGRVTPAWRIFFKNIPANALVAIANQTNEESSVIFKANKVTIPETGSLDGHLAQLDVDGDISDSGIVAAEAQTEAVDVTVNDIAGINALVAVVNGIITKLKTSGIMES